MAYASSSDVGGLCRNLLGNLPDFTQSSSPTLTQVDSWLSSGCAVINSFLASHGYGAIPAGAAAYGVAQQANALYAAWMAERSRINARVSADERTRADMLKKDMEYHLDLLKMMDLSQAGVSQTSRVYAGGISKADKSTVEGDSDRVVPRFRRGMFSNKDARSPGDTSAS